MSSKLISRSTFLVATALAAACATAYKDGLPDERSPQFEVPVGSRLLLQRSVEVAPGQRAAYLQQGRLLPWYHVNQYAPYCALALQAGGDVAQTVTPDEFVIRNVSQRSFFTLARLARTARDRDGDGMTYEVVATVMALHSARQGEVRTLTCASWGLPQGRSYLTVHDIRRALGEYLTLELAV